MRVGATTQQPKERFSYTVDYSLAMNATDSIVSATAEVFPVGLVVESTSHQSKNVRFWVSGGVSGSTYKVTLSVSTADGWTFEDEVIFKIKEL